MEAACTSEMSATKLIAAQSNILRTELTWRTWHFSKPKPVIVLWCSPWHSVLCFQEHKEKVPGHEIHFIGKCRLQKVDASEDGTWKQYEGIPRYWGRDTEVSTCSIIIYFSPWLLRISWFGDSAEVKHAITCKFLSKYGRICSVPCWPYRVYQENAYFNLNDCGCIHSHIPEGVVFSLII